MTHPGNPADKRELVLLKSSWISEMPFKVELIDYTDI